MKKSSEIREFHAHVYFDNPDSKYLAAKIRRKIKSKFYVTLGKWHNKAVGPHPLPMYQISFSGELFGKLVPWLMINRETLSVLIHPETGNCIEDHSKHSFWLGSKMSLDLDFLKSLQR